MDMNKITTLMAEKDIHTPPFLDGGKLTVTIGIGTLMAPYFHSLFQTLKEMLRGENTKPHPTDSTN
jgi:hypothetical protein